MNLDEFAFFNQQLAGMLQTGIPLEAGLRRLAEDLDRGRLRVEIKALETDLSNGTPLTEAIGRRRLPPLYVQMVKIGAAGGNLPNMLNLLADYYHRANAVWVRLKTLLVYPTIVLTASFALSIAMGLIYGYVTRESAAALGTALPGERLPGSLKWFLNVWYPAALVGIVFCGFISIWIVPKFRQWLRWHFPGFKEAALSQIASGIALMLQSGSTFRQILELVGQVEGKSPAGREVKIWQARLAEGQSQFSALSAGSKVFPLLFVWLVSGSDEDWLSGFRHAAEVYYQRAVYKVELMLYGVLPVTILALGLLIITQVIPIARAILGPMNDMMTGVGE